MNDETKERIRIASLAPVGLLLGMYDDRPCGTIEECADLALNYADKVIEKASAAEQAREGGK